MSSDRSPSAAPPGSGATSESGSRGGKRRRWPLVLGVSVLLLVALVLVAPVVVASIARGKVVTAAQESLNATASLGSLSLGLGGHVSAHDFALNDLAGQPVLALAELDVQADVGGALSGRYRADVALRGLVLHVRQLADGRLNLAALPRGAGDGSVHRDGGSAGPASETGPARGAPGGRDSGASPSGTPDGPLPDVGGHVLVEDATIIVHAPDGRQTQLQHLTCKLDLVDLSRPATFDVSGQCTGPAGAAGALQANGSVTLVHGGRIDPAQLAATLDYALENLLLAGLQPALDTLAPGAARDLRGTLAGTGHWTVEGLSRVNGRTELRLDALHLQGGAPGAPALDLPSVQLTAAATVDGEGTGSQQLRVDAGELLALRWDGTAQKLLSPEGALSGTLALDSHLGALLALLREPLGLKPGVDVAATLALQGKLQAGLKDGALASLALGADLTLKDLAARDEHGASLDLGELTSLSAGLDGRMDAAAGSVQLTRLTLQAGPVQVSAHGSVSGLPVGGAALDPAALSVADSELLLDADLDRLARVAAGFVDLGPTTFGGRLHVQSGAKTAGRRVEVGSDVALTGLRLRLPPVAADSGATAARELGPLDLTFTQSAQLDLAPGGALQLSALSLRTPFAELDGSGSFTDALDADRRAGSWKSTLRLKPGVASAQLAAFLDGLVADGQDVTVQSTLALQGSRAGVLVELRAPALALHGGALGEQPLALTALALDADLAQDSVAQTVELKSLKLAAGPSHAAGKELPGLQFTAHGTWDGAHGTLDVPELQLASAVAHGGGKLHVGNLARPGEAPLVQADVNFAGDAEPARALAAAFVPELAAAHAAGRWELALVADTAGTITHATPRLGLHGVSLDGYVTGGQALPLKDVDLALDADLSADSSGTGRLTLTSLALKAPGLTLTADGHAAGYASLAATGTATTAANPLPPALEASVQAAFTLQPRELSERLAAFLGGLALDGETLSGQLHADVAHGALVAKAGLASRELQLDLPADAAAGRPARHLVQRELQLDLDATADLSPGHDSVTLRTARFASTTAQASVTGTLGGVLAPPTASADVTLSVRSELAALFADLGALLPLPGWSGRGALAVDGTLKGDAGTLALHTTTTIDKLSLSIPRPPPAAAQAAGAAGDAAAATAGAQAPVAGAAGAPLLVEDPHVAIGVDATLATGPMDVDLARAQVASTFLTGTLAGRLLALGSPAPRAEKLVGDFTWVPGRVGALLGPLLPGQLSGDEPQPLRFTLDGPLPSGDLPALLAGCGAGATIGLGTLALPGLTASGTSSVELTGGRAHVTGKLALNGGSADLDALLDLRPAGTAAAPLATALKLDFTGVQLTQELAQLLAQVHPLLAAGEGQSVGVVSGAIGGSLQLDWPAAIPLPVALPDTAAAGDGDGHDATGGAWAALPLEKLSGSATLDLGTLSLASSPLLGQMLGNLGIAGTQQFTLAPVKVAVKDGRVGYAEPWGWTIKDFATSFSGSVGLDQSLDLSWSVPITDALASKHGFLKQLKGQSLLIPLRGTVAKPDLQWTAALEGLAQDALQAKLQEKVGQKLGPLGGLLGGKAAPGSDKPASGGNPPAAGAEPPPGAAPGTAPGAAPGGVAPPAEPAPAVTPESLLGQADALWDKGDKAGAKPLYKQLKSDFKLTLVYQLNKKRIEDRAKWKP